MIAGQLDIRPYQAADLEGVQALEAQIKPYRPEDEPERQAMFERARRAKERGDTHWMPLPPPPPGLEQIENEYLAFWVAVQAVRIVGIVGVFRFGRHLEMPAHHPLTQTWLNRPDVAELRRLRVVPDLRRAQIGTRLCEVVMDWARQYGFSLLVLNTTSAQIPALNLYRKLGFQEVGRSFVGPFELIWQAFEL